jgi:hypothetical protein
MNTLAKLIASTAALIAALALGWMAYFGVQIQHTTNMMQLHVDHTGTIFHD